MDNRSWLRDQADRYIEQCLDRDTPPHANELALRLGLSASQLSRKFARELGESAAAYLKHRRIACAQRLLTRTTLTIAEIARRCGFGTATSFHRSFLRATGSTPGAFRNAASARHNT